MIGFYERYSIDLVHWEERLSKAEGCWKLVGDYYVHGLMHGEAEALDIEERDIMLM